MRSFTFFGLVLVFLAGVNFPYTCCNSDFDRLLAVSHFFDDLGTLNFSLSEC